MIALDYLYCAFILDGMNDNRKSAKAQKGKGRPSLGPLAKHGIFTIRVHQDDLTLWRRLAADRDVTLTDFILEPLRRSLARRKAK